MKEGKKGFLATINHRYQDVQRFVNNNFTDNFKEECIRMILARSKRSLPIDEQELLEPDEKAPNLKIKIITWNIGNKTCESVDELKNIIFSHCDLQSFDIICFNLQEIIKLSAMNVLK